MQNVLIIGNVTKDVYLRMDNRINHFETDQNGIKWLDLAFDGSAYKFYSRVSIFGGASISLEVLSRFGLKAAINGTPATFLDGQVIAKDTDVCYRYILCQDDTVAYISPSEINHTHFHIPETNPEWIYIDRSANIGARAAGEILSFLNLSHDTKLALFIGEHINQYAGHMRDLIERADLIFTDVEFDQKDERQVVRIGEDYIRYHDKAVNWSTQTKQDVLTRLSTHLTIAASILGAIVLRKNNTLINSKPTSRTIIISSNAITPKERKCTNSNKTPKD